MASPSVAIDIQSRISAFEALSSKPTSPRPSSSLSPPHTNLLDVPNSPTSAALYPIAPATLSPSPTLIKPLTRSPSPSPPILGRKTSLIDLKDDWELDDVPIYNVSYATRTKPHASHSGTASAPSLSGRPSPRVVSDSKFTSYSSQSTPLIHLESSPPKSKPFAPPLPPRKASYGSLRSASNSSSSSLPRSPSVPNPSLPPIPPRKKSDSLNVDTYAPVGKLGIAIPRGHAPASSISSFHSVSLSSDGGTDVGSVSSAHVATFPMDKDHLEGDHTGENGHEVDNISLDSFENVSAVSPSISSISTDWGNGEYTYAKRQPPKLPQRPKPPSHPQSLSTTPNPKSPPASANLNISINNSVPISSPRISPPLLPKHPPPPPPPSRTRPPPASNRSSLASTVTSVSDQSSVLSAATSRTSLSSIRPSLVTPKPTPSALLLQQKLTRPTPIPPAATARYEAVFNANVRAQRQFEKERERRTLSPPPGRKVRQAAGWRGLSVDLITNPEHTPLPPSNAPSPRSSVDEEEVRSEDRLDGRVAAAIWKKSKLDRAKLKDIWTECDPPNVGSLDRPAFIKGMWRIDEELRRAQLTRHLAVPSVTSPTSRQPPRRKPSKPILR